MLRLRYINPKILKNESRNYYPNFRNVDRFTHPHDCVYMEVQRR